MKTLPTINPNQPIAIDLETCDPELKTLAPGYITKVGFVAGFAIAAQEGSFYIPVGHTEGYNYDLNEVVKWLNHICSADTDKIFHNAQYDLGWLKYVGVQIHGKIFDTMLGAALLDENRRSYSLDAIGKEYLNEGKNETALELSVKSKYAKTKTHKTNIRLREEIQIKYQPYFEAKIKTDPYFDLYPDEIKQKYTVTGIIRNNRGQELYKVPTLTMSAIKSLLWSVDPEEMGSYPIQDVDLTYRLYKHFLPLLEEQDLMNVMDLENELLPCLLEMREQGVRIDIDKAIKLDKRYTKELKHHQTVLNNLAGKEINVNIIDDLVFLCDKWNLKYSKTSKGNPCFDSEHMPDHIAFNSVKEIRKLNKARDTYIRGYFFGSSFNGRLHGQYNQLKSDEGGTVTGRLSSSNPNLQNIPARGELGELMRSLFIPDAPSDEDWLCMDFSGQEPKMLVNLVLLLDKALGSRQVTDKTTGEVFIKHEEAFPGADLARSPEFAGRKADFHTATSKYCMITENKKKGITVTDEELMKQAKDFRGLAKSIGLGTMYGSGNAKIAEEMTKKGHPMTPTEAAEIRESIYNGVPFLRAITKFVTDLAKRRGYVLTLLKRRGRFDLWELPVWDLPANADKPPYFKTQGEAIKWQQQNGLAYENKYSCSLGRPQRAFAYKALNKVIQGSSADQTKTAMLHIYKRKQLNEKSLDIYYRRSKVIPPKTRIQVHDELNFCINKGEDVKWYQDTMENSLPLLVESVAEPGVGANWKEAKH